MINLPAKHPSEAFTLTFDFTRLTTGIDSASVSISVDSAGMDASPEAMLDGAAQIIGTTVLQRVRGGVDLANYFFAATAVSGLDIWSAEALLPVRVKR